MRRGFAPWQGALVLGNCNSDCRMRARRCGCCKPQHVSTEFTVKNRYQKDMAHVVKERERAAELRSNAHQQADSDLKKADKIFAQDGVDAAAAQDKRYGRVVDNLARAEASAINRDAIAGSPGSHPLGTVVVTTGSAMAGAAADHVVGEPVHPTVEEAYWRDALVNEPYYDNRYTFDDYAPAYRAGYLSHHEHKDLVWTHAEPRLSTGWHDVKGISRLHWDQARKASRAAWHRADLTSP
jgi:hypothetical protein